MFLPIYRIYWIIAVAACFGYSVFLVLDLISKYNDNPLIISFQSKETQISQLPFPAITICNVNILKGPIIRDTVYEYDRRIQEAERHNLTEDQLMSQPGFLSILTDMLQFCFQAKSFRRYMREKIYDIEGHPDYVMKVNKYLMASSEKVYEELNQIIANHSNELGSLYKEVTHDCADMILKCMWEENVLPCEDIFFEIDTRHGRCCVFNMMPKYILGDLPDNDTRKTDEENRLPDLAMEEWKQFNLSDMILSEDSTVKTSYPRRQKAGGKPFGLSVLINPQLDLYSTCNTNDALGLKMVAHAPISFPSIMDMGMPIPHSSEVFVEIEPELSIGNEDLRSVDLKRRSCYLRGEKILKGYKFYSAENCLEECMAELMYQICLCVRYDMPRNASQKLCGAKDNECIARVRSNGNIIDESSGKSGRCSFCWPPCTEVHYKMQQTQFPLRENYSSILYDTNKTASNYSILHIYFGTDSVYATERNSLYDASALIANAGGLLGLTLGFSIVALLELIYYFTLGAWFKYKTFQDNNTNEDGFATKPARNKRFFRPPSHIFNSKQAIKPAVVSEAEYYNWAERRSQLLGHIKPVNNSMSEKPEKKGFVSSLKRVSTVSKQVPYPYLC